MKGESKKIINKRLKNAKIALERMAFEEHKAEHEEYKQALHKFNYARSIDKSRQSKKFERALPLVRAAIVFAATRTGGTARRHRARV